MRVYFVVDIMNGKVVAARSGERERYVSINLSSEIVKSDDPFEVLEEVSPKYLYVADLDRICGIGENVKLIEDMSEKVHELIADCGFKAGEKIDYKFKPVLGSETYDLTKIESKNVYVSLDFMEDFLDASGKFKSWKKAVEFLNTLELEAIIVLTIKRVGTFFADFELAEEVVRISDHPVMLGGGISGVEDLDRAKEIGLHGVLIATAVHKRKVPLEVVREGEY